MRPSVRRTVNCSSVTSTATAIGSRSSSKVVIPCLQKFCLARFYNSTNIAQFVCRKTPIPGQSNWMEPEFSAVSVAMDMNVWRFDMIGAIEPKGIRSILKHSRHCVSVPLIGLAFSGREACLVAHNTMSLDKSQCRARLFSGRFHQCPDRPVLPWAGTTR